MGKGAWSLIYTRERGRGFMTIPYKEKGELPLDKTIKVKGGVALVQYHISGRGRGFMISPYKKKGACPLDNTI